jgi:glycosyltransferase involved in cell wall biosynthesis
MRQIKHQTDKIIVDGRLLSNEPTGISRYTKELIKGITEHYDKALISIVVNTEYSNIADYNIIRTNLKPYNPLHFILFSIFINRQDYSIFYSSFYSGLYFTRKRKQIVTVHDLMYLRIKNYFSTSALINSICKIFFNFIVRSTLRASNLAISVSVTTQNDLIELFKKDSVVIGEGVNELKKNEFQKNELHESGRIARISALKRIEKDKYFLYVGNFRRQKNIPFLIEAFKKSKTPFKLVLVGDTNCTNYYELHKNSGDRSEDILFTGILEDYEIHDLYQNCLAFVMPSLYEGFGLTILEAYSAGARVLSSNQGALSEFQDLNINYFSPFNVNELMFLLQNVEKLPKPTEVEINMMRKIYSWENQIDKIIEAVEWVDGNQ